MGRSSQQSTPGNPPGVAGRLVAEGGVSGLEGSHAVPCSGRGPPWVPVNATSAIANLRAQSAPVATLSLAAALAVPLLLLARFSATLPALYGVVIALAIVGLGVLFVTMRSRPSVIVGVLLIWFAAQNMVAALVAPYAPGWVVTSLVVFKEAMYLLLLAVAGLLAARELWPGRARASSITWPELARSAAARLHPADMLALAFLGFVGLAFLLGSEDLTSRLVNARRFASLPIFYFIGRLLLPKVTELRAATSAVVWIGVAVAVFGLVEWFILGEAFWRDVVRILSFQEASISAGLQPEAQQQREGLPYNWWTFIPFRVRRLVSTFAEPTTLSIYLALALTLSPFAIRLRPGPAFALPISPAGIRAQVARWPWHGIAIVAVLGLSMALTLGKGGAMIAAVAIVIALANTTRRLALRVVPALVVLAAIGLLVGLAIPGIEANVRDHLYGLMSGAVHLLQEPLGSGLGATGFWGSGLRVGTDSTIGTIAGQLGLVAVVLWLGWAVLVVKALLPPDSDPPSPPVVPTRLRQALAGALAGLFGLSLLSTSASGLLGVAAYFLLAGWAIATIRASGDDDRGRRPAEGGEAQPR
jgi:hypothetical protein